MKIEDELKQKSFINPQQKAFLNLRFTANYLNTISKLTMKPFGITPQQYNVLRILKGKYPEFRSSEEIKAVMLDKSPDLTRLVDRLVDKAYVTREVCTGNRRKLDIGISKKGLSLIDKMKPSLKSTHNIMNSITNEEAEELSRILDKMRE